MLFFKTHKGQVTLNFLFSFFAAVVIFAAMMKILHWQGADIAIMVGLMSETCVFSIMAFLVPPPEEPHWQRYFPNINEHPDVERARTGKFEVTPLTLPGASGTIQHLNTAAEGTKQFHEQVQILTKNLSSLNTIYELELQDTNSHLKAMNQFYSNLVQASQAMEGSVGDAKKAHDQIAILANNLGRLNQIYGNMLSAMQGRA